MRKRELEIKVQQDINVYNHHALPLCIFSADQHLIPWIYEHYIEIFSGVSRDGYIFADFLEFWSPYREICEAVHMGIAFMNVVSDIVGYIVDALDREYYVIISLDGYYLPCRKNYLQTHGVISFLIFGYDLDQNQFQVIGFDKKQSFTKMTISFQDFVKAFHNVKEHYQKFAPWCENNVIEMIKRWEFTEDYPFDLAVFRSKLSNYLNSRKNASVFFSRIRDNREVRFGLEVYDDIIDHLQGKKNADFRLFHLIFESKKSIYDRLVFISQKYLIPEELQQRIGDYQKIVKNMNQTRLLYLKKSRRDDGKNLFDKDTMRLIDLIHESKDEEKTLLQSIHDGLIHLQGVSNV